MSWNSLNPARKAIRTSDPESRAGTIRKDVARDAAGSQIEVMMRRLQFALVALIALVSVPANGMPQGSVSGVVRDSAGIPQIGAVVQLLRPDLSVQATVYTNASGRFNIPAVVPGRYSIKAMGTSFLPSLRENVRIHANTVVNLTLNTLYEVMQWMPAEPRAANAQKDDWAWTLRSAANRPLLRWLEDGPLVVVSDGAGGRPRLNARIMASGQEGSFGESGERISAAVEETPSSSRELLARVDFAPGSDAGLESMLGFRQDLGFAGAVQSVAAVAVHPEITTSGSEGLEEAAIRTFETMALGDEFEAEVGSEQVLARFAQHSPNTVAAALPFASVGWRDGDNSLHYRMTTILPAGQDAEETEARAWLPQISVRDGELVLARGVHQEVAWERRTDASGMAVTLFADSIEHPVIEGTADSGAEDALYDRASGLLHAAGPGYSSTGMLATVDRRLGGGNLIRLSYANGNALVIPAPQGSAQSASLAQVLAGTHPRRTQMYALSLSGILDGTGTRWRASYRWQPEETVSSVAPFAANAEDPYLNLHVRQPIRLMRAGTGQFEALMDMRNLLAQGYRPYLLGDGSLLVFAQDQRSLSAGLVFTF